MKIIRFFLKLANWIVIIGISFFALYILSANFNVFGQYRSFLVQSGSMEPSIMTGDIIVTQSKSDYLKNDVITFRNNSDRIVTHRVFRIEEDLEKKYQTKGDANVTGDEDLVAQKQIIGKVVLVIPKLGYLAAFSKTPSGLIFLILIPAVIFILDELVKINTHAQPKN